MGTGGSRYGAGRPGWRRKCEQMKRLDIRDLSRRGRLSPGQHFSWSWKLGDEPCGSIGVESFTCYLELSYTWTTWNDDPRHLRYSIPIERTPCTYGGSRPWFRCSRCNRRCAVIYGVATNDGRFGCRVCMRLAHSSEAESQMDRLWRKQSKIEARLLDGEIKPKGMRWRTYNQLIDRINQIEQQKDVHFLASRLCRGVMNLEHLFES
jgi:hypothetical protein